MTKKLILITIAALFTVNVWGQTWQTGTGNKIYYNAGKVGIGTDNPTHLLTVEEVGSSYIAAKRTGLYASTAILGATTGSVRLYARNGGTGATDLFFQTGTTDKMVIKAGGNVGIGTTDPTSRLEVISASSSNWAIRTNGNIAVLGNILNANQVLATIRGYHQIVDPNAYLLKVGIQGGGSGDWERFVIKGNGNIGIGTKNPTEKLEIAGNIKVKKVIVEDEISLGYNLLKFQCPAGSTDNIYTTTTSSIYEGNWNFFSKYDNILINAGVNLNNARDIYIKTGGVDRLFIGRSSGNVGIGTTNPKYKLAVKGTIGCGEIKVENVTGWPDFVFEPIYNLRTLAELETYIQQNKHLPEIPTTAEVKENGISVGEMNAKLLQKIEELILYTIQQQEVIETLKQGMEAQNKRIEQLEQK